jgi:putative DNA primase/helicase
VPIEPNGLENITKKGVDWLDVYNHSLAEFKHQVRECLKLDL